MDKLTPFHIVLLAMFGIAAILGLILFANYGGLGGSTQSVGVVRVWGTLPQESIEETLNTLKANNESYRDVSYTQKSSSGFGTELSNAIAAGEGPDLVLMPLEEAYAERNKFQIIAYSSIPKRTFTDTYVPLFELLLTEEGTYGVPFLVDPLVLYYNRTALSSANIVSVPSSWEGIAGIVPRLTVRDGAGTVSRSALALGEYSNVQNARAIVSLLFLQAGTPISQQTAQGVRSALDGAESFGTTPAESALNFFTQFADPAKTVYSWNRALPNSRQAFIAGDLVFYVGFASERPFIAAANPNLDFDMRVVPQPATATTRATYGAGYVFMLPKQSANPTGAYTVASDLGAPTTMLTTATTLSMSPARKSLLSASPNDTFGPIIYASALIAKSWLSPLPTVTDGIFAGMISSVTSGRLDVTQAINAASQSLDASLR